jgi:hypothetical protein
VTVLACSSSEDEPRAPIAPTPENIQAVCTEWARVGCEKSQECLGQDDDQAACIEADTADCVRDMAAEEPQCRTYRLGAMDRCSEDLDRETCTEYCGESGQSCCFYCPYFCPAA